MWPHLVSTVHRMPSGAATGGQRPLLLSTTLPLDLETLPTCTTGLSKYCGDPHSVWGMWPPLLLFQCLLKTQLLSSFAVWPTWLLPDGQSWQWNNSSVNSSESSLRDLTLHTVEAVIASRVLEPVLGPQWLHRRLLPGEVLAIVGMAWVSWGSEGPLCVQVHGEQREKKVEVVCPGGGGGSSLLPRVVLRTGCTRLNTY